ncbi:neuraminidase-like domain-containing protein [Massilia sp. YIM B04103]|uniref:Tc toxin subunit A-related protein n=1 Tax=Massilia sp. YIM B04103 TaxID=2963106 RepID=UPI00210A2039|nr:neuraminidase-like domain-containing protein [Massilia sp. YIM B04103]
MADRNSFVPVDSKLKSFLALNPAVQLATTDFYDPDVVAKLRFDAGEAQATLNLVHAHQRLSALSANGATVNRLYQAGLHSAASIAALSLDELRQQVRAPDLQAQLDDVHRRAVDLHSRAVHLFAQMRSALSPHARGLAPNQLAGVLTKAFGHLPSFAELFGSQDYLAAPHCQSVLGPAAYFVDLMRVVEANISNNSKNQIPVQARLQTRRPGLFGLALTCANSETPVPKLRIVNDAVADLLRQKKLADPDYAMASSVYPRSVPANVALARSRAAMQALGPSLAELYTVFARRGAGQDALPDATAIAAEQLKLTAETVALVTQPRQDAALAACFGGGATLLARPLATTVGIAKDALTVSGSGFSAAAAAPGTVLRVGESLRAVVKVLNDSALEVDQSWPVTEAGAAGEFVLPATLSQVALMGARTGLADSEVASLFVQDLDQEELRAGLAAKFYVNAGSDLPPARVIADGTDVSYTLQVIAHLDAARIDRINRMLRLAASSGRAIPDLDWVLHALQLDLDVGALAPLWAALQLADRLALPVDEACGLWSVLKTWGRGNGPRPADRFDQVFNGTADAAAYRPQYADNPLFTAEPRSWSLASQEADARQTRTWLAAALGVSDKDLSLIGAWVAAGADTLTLDVPTLSRLWAPARLARCLKLPVKDVLALTRLAGVAAWRAPADVMAVIAMKQFLSERGLTLADLRFIIEGEAGDLKEVVRPDDVQPFLDLLRQVGAAWLVSAASFVDFSRDVALRIIDNLVYNQVIDKSGVVLFPAWKLSFAVLSPVFPLSARQLVVPDLISRPQALEAFEQLAASPVLQADSLAAPVDAATDLSFLFPAVDPAQRPQMIEAVRAILVNLSHRIEASVAVTRPALQIQQDGVSGSLAELFKIAPASASTVVNEVLAAAFPGVEPRLLLLTALDDKQMAAPLCLASRVLYLADLYALSSEDLQDAARYPAAFGLSALHRPTLAAVRALGDYAAMQARYETAPEPRRDIAAYLTTGEVERLTRATGWDDKAYRKLTAALWGGSFTPDPGRLWQIQSCFDLAAALGTDTGSCLQLAGMALLPPMTEPVPPPAWTVYRQNADTLVEMLRAKSAGGDWTRAVAPVNAALDTARRNAGVPLTVWLMQPDIASPRALSEYLLLDVETSACDTTSAIVEATAAVQTYLQRCRMSLEPGVASLGGIAEAWWPWLSNYRMWEANRKIFLYPESYLNPNLRQQRTDLFQAMQDELQQSDITAGSVERAYRNYITSFGELAKLRTVDSTRAMAPHPISGTAVNTVFFLGRTEAKPYTYYYRTLREGNIWSQWSKINVAMASADATIVYVFHRLFVFWVEVEANKGSYIKSGTQKDTGTRRANVRYAYQHIDGTWSAPQTVDSDILYQAQPLTYFNSIINLNAGTPSLSGIDPAMNYWKRVFLQAVPASDDSGERLMVMFGNGYAIPADPIVKPPDTSSIDTSDEHKMLSQTYIMSQLGKAIGAGKQGSVVLAPMAFLGLGMEASFTLSYLVDFTDGSPTATQPLSFTRYQQDYGPILSRSILIDSAFADSADYPKRVVAAPLPMITNVNPALRTLAVKNQAGWFVFDNGDEAFLMTPQNVTLKSVQGILRFEHRSVEVNTLDGGTQTVDCQLIGCGPYWENQIDPQRFRFNFTRLTTSATNRLLKTITFGGIERLLSLETQEAGGPATLDFSRFYPDGQKPARVIPPAAMNGGAVDFQGAYRPYFEEMFFHLPFFIANQLNAAQRFEEAKRWYEYIFDPAAVSKGQVPPPDAPNSVYWQYLPLRSLKPTTLVDMLTDATAIEAWNAHPFDPHTVAQLRPVAYEKTIVMHYIDNLLDWADNRFQEDTRESVNQATLLYLTAANLLGNRPRQRGTVKPRAPLNFADIQKDYQGSLIPQFLIELEQLLPTPQPGHLPLEPAPFNAISAYFSVPENPDFIAYWDRLDDRLYKIRNCLSLNGIFRQLPLFAPVIDPRQLLRSGDGGGAAGVIGQGPNTVPHYRFQVMLDRAKQLTAMVMGFGAGLLAALEKKDGEELQLLRQRHEHAVLLQTAEMKAQLRDEGQKQVTALQQAKAAAQARHAHYSKLLEDGLSEAEKTSMTTMILANVFQTTSGVIRTVAGAAHLAPNAGSPFAMTYGGREIGSSLGAFSSAMDVAAGVLNFASTLSGVIGNYERRAQEWTLQQQNASYEVAQTGAQLEAAQARLDALNQDVEISQLSLLQNAEIEKVLTDKFTSAELYGWMATRLSTVYFQSFKLALDLAAAAQRALQYELDSDSQFLDVGLWNAGRRGLTAGETLQMALAGMEHSYFSTNRRRLTVEKTISLWALDPLALIQLRQSGSCTFDLSEQLFDYDFPGHYCRKIERVSVTIPAVVGPYQNVHGTLTQTSNTILITPDDNSVSFLLGKAAAPTDDTLRLNWRAGQQIVLSRGTLDGTISGAPPEERYLPFEGTGAVSSWRLDLPPGSNRIDFSTIADVVLVLNYSALNGGQKLTDTVLGCLSTEYAGQAMLPLPQFFPDAWPALLQPPYSMSFPVGPSVLPANLDAPETTQVHVLFDIRGQFTGKLEAALTPPAGEALSLTVTNTQRSVQQPVRCALAPEGVWTLSLASLPPDLKPEALHGVTLVFDYTATVIRQTDLARRLPCRG